MPHGHPLSRKTPVEILKGDYAPTPATTAARLEALESRVGRIERILGMVAGVLDKMRRAEG